MKTAKISTILVLALGLMVCLVEIGEAVPMGTAFTYQGRLIDANIPANGLYDLQFKIYDHADPCSGAEVAPPVLLEYVEILDGYFTVDVDFGEGIFMGEARWLGVGVRPWDSEEPFEDFDEPQPMGPAPNAIYADNAGKLNNKTYQEFANVDATGMTGFLPKYLGLFQLTKSAIHEQTGNVCIGAQGFAQDKLDVWGDIRVRGDDIKDEYGVKRITMIASGRMDLKECTGKAVITITKQGKVGIGNVGPVQDVDIKGGVLIDNSDNFDPIGNAAVALTVNCRKIKTLCIFVIMTRILKWWLTMTARLVSAQRTPTKR